MLQRFLFVGISLLEAWALPGSDVIGDGTEDLEALPPRPKTAKHPSTASPKASPAGDLSGDLKNDLPAKGADSGEGKNKGPIGEGPEDLTADRPGTVPPKKESPFFVEMEDLRPEGLLSPKAMKAYKISDEMRELVYQIANDLDAWGKERTRLIYSAESLERKVAETYKLWPDDLVFRGFCMSARRSVLVLEEELRNEPRKWAQVRWSFMEVQKEIKKLRQASVAQAKLEPKPVELKTKDGKIILVEAPKTEAQLRQEEAKNKLENLLKQKEILKKDQEEQKEKEKKD